MSFAKGKYAFGYCDKTGFRYDLKDLVDEVNNGTKTGFRVGKDVGKNVLVKDVKKVILLQIK